jgi:TonB family protein
VRSEFAVPVFALAVATFAAAQPAPTLPPDTTAQSTYKIGGNVSAPIILHSVEAEFSDYARKNGICGATLIGLIVDANGLPQNIHVVRSLEPSLDEKAMDAIRQYRFKPAMKDGKIPVPVQITVEVDFRLYKKGPGNDGCSTEFPAPVHPAFGGGHLVDPPVLISSVQPLYTDEARKNHITGTCTLQVTIDANGVPQNVRVVNGLDPGLDANAIEAVKQWRYKPATEKGVAVPFDSTVDVNFRLRKWF